jgi:polysaccharide biosynthesis PFTS motif protein
MIKSGKYQLRGFSKNKKSKIPIDILSLKQKLSDTQIDIGKNSYLEKLFDRNQKELELIFRQYIFSKIYLSANLNKKIYESIGDGTKKIKYPLHKSWLKALQTFGFTVDSKYWYIFVISQFIKGMYRLAQSLYFLVFRNNTISEYVYFFDLGPDNLKSYINQSSENIFSWYSKRFDSDILKYHSVKNRKNLSIGFESPEALYLKSIKISLPGLSEWIFYLLGSFRAITDSIIGLMHGNTVRMILLPETLDYIYVNLIPKEMLAKEYLFNFSNHLYRPFWTYLAEEKGSKVTFYFY